MKLGLFIDPPIGPDGGDPLADNGASAEITITRGPALAAAPFGVFFEVTGFTGFNAAGPGPGEAYDARYHDLYFMWNFDDDYTYSAPQNVRPEHLSAGRTTGPVVSHTYRTPGSYNPSVLIIEPATGKYCTAYLADPLSVSDPNAAFPGTNTLYVDATDGGAGAPPGALILGSFDAAISAIKGQERNPKRIMLRRDQAYTFSGTNVGFGSGDLLPSLHIVAAPGSGARPVLNVTGQTIWYDAATSGIDKDFVVTDIALTGLWDATTETGTALTFVLLGDNPPTLVVLDKCYCSGFDMVFNNALSAVNGETSCKIFNDTTITNWREYGVFEGKALHTAFTGSSVVQDINARSGGPFDGTRNQQGAFRSGNSYGNTIAQGSEFFSRAGWFEQGTSSGYFTVQDAFRYNSIPVAETAKLNIQGCYLEGGYDVLTIGHMNRGPGVAINGMVEKTTLVSAFSTTRLALIEYGGTTLRNNLMVFADAPVTHPSFDPRDFVGVDAYGANPNNINSPIRVYNNTMINLRSAANYTGTEIAATEYSEEGATTHADVLFANNVIHQPNLTSPITADAPLNLVNDGDWGAPYYNGYISDVFPTLQTQWANPADTLASFAPLLGSAALGDADNDPVAHDDFYGNSRPQYPSRGAFEIGS